MFPHAGTVVASTPWDDLQDWINGLDPLAILAAAGMTVFILTLVMALTREEE